MLEALDIGVVDGLLYAFLILCLLQFLGFRQFCRSAFQVILVPIPLFFVYVLPALTLTFLAFWLISSSNTSSIFLYFIFCAVALSVWIATFSIHTKWGEDIKSYAADLPRLFGIDPSWENPLLDYQEKVSHFNGRTIGYATFEWERANMQMLFRLLKDAAKGASQKHRWITAAFLVSFVHAQWGLNIYEMEDKFPIIGSFLLAAFELAPFLGFGLILIIGFMVNHLSLRLGRLIVYSDMRVLSVGFKDCLTYAIQEKPVIKGTTLSFIEDKKSIIKEEIGSQTENAQVYKMANGRKSYVLHHRMSSLQIAELAKLLNKYDADWLEKATTEEISVLEKRFDEATQY